MPSKLSYFLIASLAANAALLGVVGGRLLNDDRPTRTLSNRPSNDVVQAAWAQLPDAERVDLRKELHSAWIDMKPDRQKLQEASKAVHDAAMEEPFDETRLRGAMIVFQQRQQMMQHRAEDILISHLGKMPADARATAAVGLLTPFSARIQRSDHPHGDGRDRQRPDSQDVQPPMKAPAADGPTSPDR
ncbi:MAG: periplasmic heavy metal sensor [Alphaproteobacteria bacterium]|nr:periplasmic heavy metal sensor [Alphaproteobacteria bacterium]